ncbi:MAG: DUF962 domain-containing protein, partial [Steroidobacteraceae bacterium]|nr:DUF962 domain-containing protein [Steroidobacteraceae bacterium]
MRAIEDWLADYGASHRHPANERLHWICVPLIVLSVLGLLASLPVPAALATALRGFDWALVAIGVTTVYYAALSLPLAAGALIALVLLYVLLAVLRALPWPLWSTSLVVFILAWIGQFIGHAIEGKRPSFFRDLQFLLIGPLWLVAAVYDSLELR